MVASRIIACLDVRAGRVVKGVRFQGLSDRGDPSTLAQTYAREGADEIVFLDVTATLEGRAALLDAVRATAENLFVPLTVGGGVRTVADAHSLLRAGADKVAVNTAAVEDPTLITAIAASYGSQCVVVAIDAMRYGADWNVRTHAGSRSTKWSAVAWAREAVRRGAGEILLTSMDADGTQAGYDVELTRAVAAAVTVPVVASGGAGTPGDVLRILTQGNADAALVASLFHDGRYRPVDLKRAIASAVEVRP